MTDGAGSRSFPPLSVATDLTLTINGATADIASTGDRLFVGFGSITDALRALRGQPDGGETVLDGLLRASDLTVEVRVRDRTVAVAGAGARPGSVSRLVGVDPIEARIGGILGAVGAGVSAGIATVRRFLD